MILFIPACVSNSDLVSFLVEKKRSGKENADFYSDKTEDQTAKQRLCYQSLNLG